MRILITGVTGYIGRHLCATLADAGHDVVGTSRKPAGVDLPGLTQAFAWSPATEPLSAQALDGVDGVVHLTGESVAGRWTAAKKRALRASRVDSAANVVAGITASSHKPSVFVGGSAVGFYGNRGDDELTEDDPAGNDFLARLTADWEAAAQDVTRLGVRSVLTRTGMVVGPGAKFLAPQLPLAKLGLGGRLGSGNQWWSWVHVDDVTGIINLALEDASIEGPINVTSPHIARQRDFAKTLGHVLHRPAFVWAPGLAIKLILGEFSDEVLTSKRAFPAAALAAGYTFAYPSLEPALQHAIRG
jgi:uncharacterized protein (TIGR01777 family)